MNDIKILIVFMTIGLSGFAGSAKIHLTPIKLNEVSFTSIFGTTKTNQERVYCLLGSGFFRAPSSESTDSLIGAWIKMHPDASVIPISCINASQQKKKSEIVYCWVIQNEDTLNNYLVKNGCVPGGTMVRPQTLHEMSRKEIGYYKTSGSKSEIKVFIDRSSYEKFIDQIKFAEMFARDNKLGIWKGENKN